MLAEAEFVWDGHTISKFQGPGALHYPIYGETKRLLDYNGPNGHHQCVADHATADHEVIGTASGNTFDLEIHSSNPLVHPSPDIDGVLQGTVSVDGSVQLKATTDEFPSQGVRVVREGVELGTAIVNDASCIGENNVQGVSGAVRLFTGLTSEDNHFDIAMPIPLPGNSSLQDSQTSVLCNPSGAPAPGPAVYIGNTVPAPLIAAWPARVSRILVAPSHDGSKANGPFVTLGAAEQKGLVILTRQAGGVVITGALGKPLVISVTGGRRVVGIFAAVPPNQTHVLRYLLPSGAAMIMPDARSGPKVLRHGHLIPSRQLPAPHTRVQIAKRVGSMRLLRFTVTSRAPLAGTYVVVGTHGPLLAHHGAFVLRRSAGVVRYYSVDVLGDIEQPHRLR